MRKMQYLVLFLLMSCSIPSVMTDYDRAINFDDFKTYAFYEDVGAGLHELDVNRAISAINLELKQRGFQDSENPDFYINVTAKIVENQNNNLIGIGVGSGGGNGGFGISGGIPIGAKKLNEELVIEFVNAKTDQIIWEGALNSKIKENSTPEEKELHYNEVVKRIIIHYPPNNEN